MKRSINPALALMAVCALAGCSNQDGGSSTNPATGGSGTGSAGTGTAGTGSEVAGPSGTSTSTARAGTGASSTSAAGTGASGTGASGAGTSGTSTAGTGAATAGASASGSGGSGTASPSAGSGGNSMSGTAGTTGAAGGSAPVMPGECVGDWKPGTYPPDFITGEGASSLPAIGGRNYAVHVPKGYDCHLPTPIVFCLHGLGQNGYMFCVNGTSTPKRTGGMVAKADEEGFIVVMSSGLGPSAADVKVVRDIFKNLEGHLNIDHKRVYATGHSFGGSLSFLLACTAADLFTAGAPNAWTMLPGSCAPAQPISVLVSHGDQDAIAPGGNPAAAIKSLAMLNGCSAMESPAMVPMSGGDTTCITHTGCKNGVEVTRCTIKGGGHVWFGDASCGTGAPGACDIVGANSMYYVNTDFAWDFLKRFSR